MRGIDGGYLTGEHLAARERPVVSHMDLAERLEGARTCTRSRTTNVLEPGTNG
jgi:hypothetical protein